MTDIKARLARWMHRTAHRLAPISRTWDGHVFDRASDDLGQAYLVVETDGIYTGTAVYINGQPVTNCTSVSFEIKVGGLAHAVVELDDVPLKLKDATSGGATQGVDP